MGGEFFEQSALARPLQHTREMFAQDASPTRARSATGDTLATIDREDRLAGTLLGTAIGDALGLPFEGLEASVIASRFDRPRGYRLLGTRGYFSDDTELSALIARALCLEPEDPARCAAIFRRSLVGFVARLPFGIGLTTLRAGLRAALFIRPTGLRSGGNGAAMRAPIVGARFSEEASRRHRFGVALARVTHDDPIAVQAALYVAEVAALSVRSPRSVDRHRLISRASQSIEDATLHHAVAEARRLVGRGVEPIEASAALGSTGYVVHTVGIVTYSFLRHGDAPRDAVDAAIACGGDTDTHAAIVGALMGALHGARALPLALIVALNDGPFGPSHLLGLSSALARGSRPPRFSAIGSLARNVALYPVILLHVLLRGIRAVRAALRSI